MVPCIKDFHKKNKQFFEDYLIVVWPSQNQQFLDAHQRQLEDFMVSNLDKRCSSDGYSRAQVESTENKI